MVTINILNSLKVIGDLSVAGENAVAQIQLEALWEKIPSPKESVLNSYLIVSYGAVISLETQNLDTAWEWAKRGLAYSGNFNLMGESEFLAGQVAFARGDIETARKYFKMVKKMSGKRLFRSKDLRYAQLVDAVDHRSH
ncbi:MAG TPA: hypothetical protein VGM64_03735 [Lacunisphaera sp.]|jgi:hypothetical protein